MQQTDAGHGKQSRQPAMDRAATAVPVRAAAGASGSSAGEAALAAVATKPAEAFNHGCPACAALGHPPPSRCAFLSAANCLLVEWGMRML